MEDTPEPQPAHGSKQEQLSEVVTSFPGNEDVATDGYFRSPFEAAPGLEALSTAAASNYDYMQPVCLICSSIKRGIYPTSEICVGWFDTSRNRFRRLNSEISLFSLFLR